MNAINIFNIKTYIVFYKKIIDYFQNKSLYNRNKKIIINFFMLDKKCIDTTKQCKELREQYKSDIERIQKSAFCTQCSIVFIKNEYIRKLINAQD